MSASRLLLSDHLSVFTSAAVVEAVDRCREQRRALVCLLYPDGGVDASAQAETLKSPPLRPRLAAEAVTIALPVAPVDARPGATFTEPLERDQDRYLASRQFRSLYPTPIVPAVAVVGADGRLLAYQQGGCDAKKLEQVVMQGLDQWRRSTLADAAESRVHQARLVDQGEARVGDGQPSSVSPLSSAPSPMPKPRKKPAPAPASSSPPVTTRTTSNPDADGTCQEEQEKNVRCVDAVCTLPPSPAPRGVKTGARPTDYITTIRVHVRGGGKKDKPTTPTTSSSPLRDGQSKNPLSATFDKDTVTVGEVEAWLRGTGMAVGPSGSYDLVCLYPKLVLSGREEEVTLASLGLSGRLQLWLVPRRGGTRRAASPRGWISWIYTWLRWLWVAILGMFYQGRGGVGVEGAEGTPPGKSTSPSLEAAMEKENADDREEYFGGDSTTFLSRGKDE